MHCSYELDNGRLLLKPLNLGVSLLTPFTATPKGKQGRARQVDLETWAPARSGSGSRASAGLLGWLDAENFFRLLLQHTTGGGVRAVFQVVVAGVVQEPHEERLLPAAALADNIPRPRLRFEIGSPPGFAAP